MNKLIAIVGLDGSGKSTQAKLLSNTLRDKGVKTLLSKAFSHQEKILYNQFVKSLSSEGVLFFFQALFAKQYSEAKEWLENGGTVVADRWDETFERYHSRNGILSNEPDLRSKLSELAFHNLKPEITFLLDIDPKKSQRRVAERQDIETFDDPIHELTSAREWYLKEAERRGWIVLDGAKKIDLIHREISSKLL